MYANSLLQVHLKMSTYFDIFLNKECVSTFGAGDEKVPCSSTEAVASWDLQKS